MIIPVKALPDRGSIAGTKRMNYVRADINDFLKSGADVARVVHDGITVDRLYMAFTVHLRTMPYSSLGIDVARRDNGVYLFKKHIKENNYE